MKATLGIGFEDRSAAFDFGIAVGEMRKVLGLLLETGRSGGGGTAQKQTMESDVVMKKDFSLKEGEKIVVRVPLGRRGRPSGAGGGAESGSDTAALFSIAPPPPAAGMSPSKSATPESTVEGKTAQELGFDDGEFGEFQ